MPDGKRKLTSVKNSIKHNNAWHPFWTGEPNKDASRTRIEDYLTKKKSVTNAIGRDSKTDYDVEIEDSKFFNNPSPSYLDLK